MAVPMKTYLTKDEVARALRVSPRTISTYVRQGTLPPPVRLGRRPLWAQDELESAIHMARHSRLVVAPAAPAPRRRGRPRKIWE